MGQILEEKDGSVGRMRPNILLVMTDEQKLDTFGYNNPVVKTPALDELIRDSLFFTKAYCSNPSCIPSRAAIATGKYPTVCRCPTYISSLPEKEKTFMTMLREAGYKTALVGKQHFAHSKIDHGYDYEIIVDGHSPLGNPAEIGPYLDFLKMEGVDYGKCSDDSLILGGTWLEKENCHIDSFVGQEGKRWLESYLAENVSGGTPWFLMVSFPGPHMPYDGEGTSCAAQYRLEDMRRPETEAADLEQKPPHFMKLNPRAYIDRYPEEVFRRTKRSYYANVSLIDRQIGEMIRVLKERHLYDSTMIIYTTDHGDFMGEFGLVSKAQYLSESLMHVPLIVKPPVKGFRGYEVHDYVTNIDIASTCLAVSGAGDKLTPDMENYPYSQYWLEENAEVRDHIYMEAHDMKAVIEDGIKTIYYVGRDYGELYNLNLDPHEKNNLWDDEDYQKLKRKAMGRIIDQMFRFSPEATVKWNVNAPEI
ncbi:sulfatase family protein [Hungatella effluvii]|uniref:sulfatase family protein n=1 Tax=Hungatella effluvii TaxID=1096246 RepID=UPI0022E8611D|nr:sulfatase-like hydrolase/transferase [Hungatella effluvii]